MSTMHKQIAGAPAGRQPLTAKAVYAFLALAVALTLLASVVLAAPFQSAIAHIGEEIPQIVHRSCRSCGEELPQGASPDHKQIAGGSPGGVLGDRGDGKTAGGIV